MWVQNNRWKLQSTNLIAPPGEGPGSLERLPFVLVDGGQGLRWVRTEDSQRCATDERAAEVPFDSVSVAEVVCLVFSRSRGSSSGAVLHAPVETAHGDNSFVGKGADTASADVATGGPRLKREVLFLSQWASEEAVLENARGWVKRLPSLLGMDLVCRVTEPTFASDDLDCKGFWLRPAGRSDDQWWNALRKHALTSISAALAEVVLWTPDLIHSRSGPRCSYRACSDYALGARGGLPDESDVARSDEGLITGVRWLTQRHWSGSIPADAPSVDPGSAAAGLTRAGSPAARYDTSADPYIARLSP